MDIPDCRYRSYKVVLWDDTASSDRPVCQIREQADGLPPAALHSDVPPGPADTPDDADLPRHRHPAQGGTMAFLDELAQVAQDPEIRRLARRRAGSHELAEDALQETYWAIARRKQPEIIRDLRAFFCRSLLREIDHQRARLIAVPTADIDIADNTQGRTWFNRHTQPSVDDEAARNFLTGRLLTRLDRERDRFAASVPGRSTEQDRYRTAIVLAAQRILSLLLEGQVTQSDWNEILRSAYPEWCDEPGLTQDAANQRLSRARRDVQSLYEHLVSRDELT
jgi:DNA-directed RNA polymerase specialized sigma24 family protein